MVWLVDWSPYLYLLSYLWCHSCCGKISVYFYFSVFISSNEYFQILIMGVLFPITTAFNQHIVWLYLVFMITKFIGFSDEAVPYFVRNMLLIIKVLPATLGFLILFLYIDHFILLWLPLLLVLCGNSLLFCFC